MENYQGDLTDIVRASSGQIGCNNSASASHVNTSPATCWQFPSDPLSFCSSIDDHDHRDDNLFGDPFSNMRDPLLHELLLVDEATATATAANRNINDLGYHEDELKSPCSIFSRIQISSSSQTRKLQQPVSPPCDSPVMAAVASASPSGIKAPAALVAIDMINANSSSKSCLVDSTGQGQISSPRNLGIKRRKSQAKKVVCIPAPAAANSRSTGEVVPCDLWAWRKYGQKPIKGSPYPRGYYRCSSSKGCSARKQVERSRTDPNMLVITYTSEHNHPWPTQRNALAGSTRSQPPRANASAAAASNGSVSPSSHQNTTKNNIKDEVKESSNDDGTMSPSNNIAPPSSNADDQMKISDEFNEGFCSSQIYKPALPDSNQSHEDFFAELGEIDADPLNDLLFTQGFTTKETKGLDPFNNIFDWSGDNSNSNTSFGETKRGL